MPTIAVVGAGPGMGLSIARTFGSRGFDVALLSRSQDNLDAHGAALAADGITAKGFPADVLDTDSLTGALETAAAHFGRIDVLEYSPGGPEPVRAHCCSPPEPDRWIPPRCSATSTPPARLCGRGS